MLGELSCNIYDRCDDAQSRLCETYRHLQTDMRRQTGRACMKGVNRELDDARAKSKLERCWILFKGACLFFANFTSDRSMCTHMQKIQ